MYKLKVPDTIAAFVRKLHPSIKQNIRFALNAILSDPCCGKSLKDELGDLRSYRIKRYRIIYRIHLKDKVIAIVAIGPRRDIYKETFRIISKEKKGK